MKQAIIEGKKSIGYLSVGESTIYAFRVWGKIKWSGNFETMRDNKLDALNDAKSLKQILI